MMPEKTNPRSFKRPQNQLHHLRLSMRGVPKDGLQALPDVIGVNGMILTVDAHENRGSNFLLISSKDMQP